MSIHNAEHRQNVIRLADFLAEHSETISQSKEAMGAAEAREATNLAGGTQPRAGGESPSQGATQQVSHGAEQTNTEQCEIREAVSQVGERIEGYTERSVQEKAPKPECLGM